MHHGYSAILQRYKLSQDGVEFLTYHGETIDLPQRFNNEVESNATVVNRFNGDAQRIVPIVEADVKTAQRVCRQRGGTLLVIQSRDEVQDLMAQLESFNYTDVLLDLHYGSNTEMLYSATDSQPFVIPGVEDTIRGKSRHYKGAIE